MEESTEEIYSRILDLSNELQVFKAISPSRPPYGVNLFDKFQAGETDISWSLYMIFNFKQYNVSFSSEHFPILEHFIQKFINPLQPADIHLQVKHPIVTRELYHIDLLVRNDDYAIIFENKINGADYQRNQLGRYIKTLLDKGYDEKQIYIVILPKDKSLSYLDNIRESVWKCPEDWNIPNSIRRCRIDDYSCWCDVNKALTDEEREHCNGCLNFKDEFTNRTIVLDSGFADWLEEVSSKEIPPRETLLKSVMVQTADYIKGVFGTRIEKQFEMDIQDLIKEKLSLNEKLINQLNKISKHLNHLDELHSELQKTSALLVDELFKEMKMNITGDYFSQQDKGIAGLFIDEKRTIVCAFCDGRDNANYMPYWGIYLPEGKAGEIKKTVKKQIKNILEKYGIDISKMKDNSQDNKISPWYLWQSCLNGAVICYDVYQEAKKTANNDIYLTQSETVEE